MNLNLIVKPTGACNAACVYCCAWRSSQSQATMAPEVVEALIRKVGEALSRAGGGHATFTWHGGEPLLLPDAFYERIVDLQERWLAPIPRARWENHVQSNLLALTPDRLPTLKRLLSAGGGKTNAVGSSFDPIPGTRVARTGDYDERWRRAVALLRAEGIPFGVVYVAHRQSLERVDEVWRFFRDEIPDASVRLNPLYREGRARDDEFSLPVLTSGEWGRFLVEMYRRWDADGRRLSINPLREVRNYHDTGDFRLVCDHGPTCSRSYLGVDTDGRVYPCGRGIDRGDLEYGHVLTDDIETLVSGPVRRAIANRHVALRVTECRDCEWWRYCHGGCAMDALMHTGDLFSRTAWCDGRRTFFREVLGEPSPKALQGGAGPARLPTPGARVRLPAGATVADVLRHGDDGSETDVSVLLADGGPDLGRALADHYLREALQPVEPLHTVFTALVERTDLDLWDALGLQATPEARAARLVRDASPEGPCRTCDVLFVCRGAARFQGGRCDGWRAALRALAAAAGDARPSPG